MEKWARICLQKSSAKAEQKPKLVRQLLQSQIANLLSSGLSTCVEMLARPISIRSHNKTASKRRIREGRLWVDVLAARPAMTMLKGLGARAQEERDNPQIHPCRQYEPSGDDAQDPSLITQNRHPVS